MDPENPPRRKRPETEPKTIDLTANRPDGDPVAPVVPDAASKPVSGATPTTGSSPMDPPASEPLGTGPATSAPAELDEKDSATAATGTSVPSSPAKTAAGAATSEATLGKTAEDKSAKDRIAEEKATSAPSFTGTGASSVADRATAAAKSSAKESSSSTARPAGSSATSARPGATGTVGGASSGAASSASSRSGPGGPGSSSATTPPVRAPSRSGALAAGILGGLVALVGAGVLQYAGVVPALGPASTVATDRDLGGEIDALKAELQSRSTAPADTAPLEQRIAALEQTIGTTGQGEAAGLEQLKSEVEQLKAGLTEQRQQVDSTTSALSTRLGEAEKKLEEPSNDVKLARAVAVTALKTAIDKGGPFLAELDALKSVSPEDPAVAGLAETASRGVPSRSDLTRDFPALADEMMVAVRGADPNQSVFARLYDSAASAVRVRPVGNVEGNDAGAIIARIEDRLTNGDLKGASLEWDGLPQVAKDAGQDFKAKLDERIRVEGLIDAAVAAGPTANQG